MCLCLLWSRDFITLLISSSSNNEGLDIIVLVSFSFIASFRIWLVADFLRFSL